jgi:hypothetical protein
VFNFIHSIHHSRHKHTHTHSLIIQQSTISHDRHFNLQNYKCY